jgi:hypothetical protein
MDVQLSPWTDEDLELERRFTAPVFRLTADGAAAGSVGYRVRPDDAVDLAGDSGV